MQSRNKPAMTTAERRYVTRIKLQPCIVCGYGGGDLAPSEAHEIAQGQWFTSIPLCADCHRGAHNGIHGRAAIWSVRKMSEMSALNETIERMVR